MSDQHGAQQTPQQQDDHGASTWKWIILLGGGLVVLLFCGGILAAIAVPAFVKYIERSKTAEATQVLTRSAQFVQNHYDSNGELPEPEGQLRTTERPPTGGEKYEPSAAGLSQKDKELWAKLGWPTGGDPLYFQYSYRVRRSDDGGEAVLKARADFDEGGPVHTATQRIEVDDGDVTIRPTVTENELE